MTGTRPRIGIIGAGRAGSALALGLSRCGYEIVAIASRTLASARRLSEQLPGSRAVSRPQDVVDVAELVLITTPDAAIAAVAGSLRWRPGVAVVHCSGVESRVLLQAAADQGAATGSLHPLQTFADRDQGAANLGGSVFAVEAEAGLRDTLLAMVSALSGRAVEVAAADKALYHASAMFASNYVITLMQMASEIWLRFGRSRPDAVEALLPLMRGAVNNIEALGLPAALTGPIARGDGATVQRHVDALQERLPELLTPYRELGLQTIPVAREQGGLSAAVAADIERILCAAAHEHDTRDSHL